MTAAARAAAAGRNAFAAPRGVQACKALQGRLPAAGDHSRRRVELLFRATQDEAVDGYAASRR